MLVVMERHMTVEEAAAYLGIDGSNVRHAIKRGRLPGARKIGRRLWVIPAVAVKEYKRTRRRGPVVKEQTCPS